MFENHVHNIFGHQTKKLEHEKYHQYTSKYDKKN